MASKPGYFGERASLQEPLGETVTLRLHPEGRIEGAVSPETLPNEHGAVIVLAWPSALRSPRREWMEELLLGNTRGAMATVEANGEFVLEGLDPRIPYDLAAGGAGKIVARPTYAVRCGAVSPVLELGHAFGVYARIIERGSDSLPISPQLDIGFDLTFQNQDANPATSKLPEWLTPLLGVPLPQRLEPFATLLVYVSPDPLGFSGPIRFESRIAGYEPQQRTFNAPDVASGIVVETLELVPLTEARERGSLQVSFQGAIDLVRSTAARGRGLVLELSDGSGQLRRYDLTLDDRGAGTVHGIPVGSHHARIIARLGGATWPEGSSWQGGIEVTSDLPAEWTLDIGDAGAIEASLTDSTGMPYRGPAVLSFEAVGAPPVAHSSSWMEFDFERAPYRLAGLAPGRYRMVSRFPLAYVQGNQHEVEVVAGRVSRPVLELRRVD